MLVKALIISSIETIPLLQQPGYVHCNKQAANFECLDLYSVIVRRATMQTLGTSCKAFPTTTLVRAKKLLFLSLVLPKLTYCSPIWRQNLIKDITVLDGMQRRASKFVLNDYSLDYKNMYHKGCIIVSNQATNQNLLLCPSVL